MDECVGHEAQVVAGKFLRQKFLHLRGQVFRPNLQRLPLPLGERFQHLASVPAPVPDFMRAARREMFPTAALPSAERSQARSRCLS